MYHEWNQSQSYDFLPAPDTVSLTAEQEARLKTVEDSGVTPLLGPPLFPLATLSIKAAQVPLKHLYSLSFHPLPHLK